MPKVYVTSGRVKGQWLVCLSGETFSAMKMTPEEAEHYADEIEVRDDTMALIASSLRKAAERCRRQGIDA